MNNNSKIVDNILIEMYALHQRCHASPEEAGAWCDAVEECMDIVYKYYPDTRVVQRKE